MDRYCSATLTYDVVNNFYIGMYSEHIKVYDKENTIYYKRK